MSATTVRSSVLATIGSTPVVRLERLVEPDMAEVWVKLESANPTGSYKDRMALAMIEGAERSGRLSPGQTVVEYTGGSTGSSLALVCALRGYPLRIVTSDAFAAEKLRTMEALGAELEVVPSAEGITPEMIPRLMARVVEIVDETGAFATDQFRNEYMPTGYTALGAELLEQLDGSLDAFCAYVGTAGCFAGTTRRLRESLPAVHRVAVEPAESPVLSGGEPGTHRIEGGGSGFWPPLLDRSDIDEVITVSTDDAFAMARRAARDEGVFSGPSTGANLVAALELARRLGAGKRVATASSIRASSISLALSTPEARETSGYRWAILAAGTAAQASFSAPAIGLPVLVPALRTKYDLSLNEIGLLLAAFWVGPLLTLLPWGIAADRYGERIVLALGLAGCAAALMGAAFAPGFISLLILLAVAGAAGASVNSASGRAVMRWFEADERGLALGVRQTAIPIGGLVAALTVPALTSAGGTEAAFLFLGALCAGGALVGAIFLRERDVRDGIEVASISQTLRDGRILRVCLASGLYVYAQVAVIGFGVLLLNDQHGLAAGTAALVIAAAQVLAIVLRIGAGRWSDLVGARITPLRRAGLAVSAGLLATALLSGGSLYLLVPTLAIAGGLSMAWNGLAFTAVAELAGASRSGAAIGFQQTFLSAIGVAGPVVFAATLSASSWTAAFLLAALFPLVGFAALRPLRAY